MDQNNNELLFMQVIIQNQQMALLSMGKIKNPVTDKIERNLEYAKISIDILDMLKHKTSGNLSGYEEKFLDEVIKELKLNYVDEANKKIDDRGASEKKEKEE